MSKKKSVLAIKFVTGFVSLGVLICSVSSIIGCYQFKTNMEDVYLSNAFDVANHVRSYFDMEEISSYVDLIKRDINGEDVESEFKAVEKSENYQKTLSRLKALRNSMEANDIYFVYVDKNVMDEESSKKENWSPFHYIFDSFHDKKSSFNLGGTGHFNLKFMEIIRGVVEDGVRPSSKKHIISKSDFGNNISALEPVPLGEDNLLLCVEIPMKLVHETVKNYLLSAVLVSIALIALVIYIYMAYLFKKVIKPINTISHEAEKFVENGVMKSASILKINTKDEIENLASSIVKMQGDINSYIENLTSITAEKERLGAELDVAKHIQASVLPCIFPAFPERSEFEVFASMTPAKEVGGDFYDFFLVDDNHLAMVIADVSGKGVPAALFMMISKTLIKSAAQTGLSPKQILEKVNNQLCENNDAEMFVTVWVGIMNLTTGHMVCTNAGHEYPAIYRKDKGFELYHDKHGFVLAGMENVRYREYDLQLNSGDIIFVYSDGVAEATDLHDQLYGTDRMIDALNNCPEKTPEELTVYVKQDVDKFVGEADQFDDITMLCVEFVGKKNNGSEKKGLGDKDSIEYGVFVK